MLERDAELSPTARSVRAVAEHFNAFGIPHHTERFHDIMNESWPSAKVAERLSDHPSIPVTVRVVWERDGETWLDGTATRWAGRRVFVRFVDERSRLGFAWVDAGDVTRR